MFSEQIPADPLLAPAIASGSAAGTSTGTASDTVESSDQYRWWVQLMAGRARARVLDSDGRVLYEIVDEALEVLRELDGRGFVEELAGAFGDEFHLQLGLGESEWVTIEVVRLA